MEIAFLILLAAFLLFLLIYIPALMLMALWRLAFGDDD